MNFSNEYAKDELRGIDISPRPWSLEKKAIALGGDHKQLLDIGCGTAYKTLRLSKYYNHIVGMDPSPDMLKHATKNIHAKSINNISVISGVAENLPFHTKKFDVVTAMLTWWNPQEIHRILNPGGNVLIECLGAEDKVIFTKFFGKDSHGWRGANIDKNTTLIETELKTKLSPYFSNVEFIHDRWQTSYTKKGLWLLLNNTTSTVRNFCPKKDENNFNTAFNTLQTDGHVLLTQSRVVTIANNSISK